MNAEQIKFVEAAPDTIITMAINDEKFMVKEDVNQVIALVIDYKRQWLVGLPKNPGSST